MSTYYFIRSVEDDEYGVLGYEIVKTEGSKDEAVKVGNKFFPYDEQAAAWSHARKLAGPGAEYTLLPVGVFQGAYKKV